MTANYHKDTPIIYSYRINRSLIPKSRRILTIIDLIEILLSLIEPNYIIIKSIYKNRDVKLWEKVRD